MVIAPALNMDIKTSDTSQVTSNALLRGEGGKERLPQLKKSGYKNGQREVVVNETYSTSYIPMMMLEKERLMSEPTPPAIATPPTNLILYSASYTTYAPQADMR